MGQWIILRIAGVDIIPLPQLCCVSDSSYLGMPSHHFSVPFVCRGRSINRVAPEVCAKGDSAYIQDCAWMGGDSSVRTFGVEAHMTVKRSRRRAIGKNTLAVLDSLPAHVA